MKSSWQKPLSLHWLDSMQKLSVSDQQLVFHSTLRTREDRVKDQILLMAEGCRDRLRDLLAMEPAVLDEDLVGVHARNDNAGKVDTRAIALERLRIGARPARLLIEADAQLPQKLSIGRASRTSA